MLFKSVTKIKMCFIYLFIAASLPYSGLALLCLSCQQGYHTPTPCATILPRDMLDPCTQPNAECIEAVEWFQDGALQLVRRACWAGPANGTGGFCQNYPFKKTGVLKNCTSCKTDLCNDKVIYEPLTPSTCQSSRKV